MKREKGTVDMDVSNISPSERAELDRLAVYLKNTDLAQQKSKEMAESSFRQWFADALKVLATGIGISLSAIVEYIKTIGTAVSVGFVRGVEISRAKGEQERERLRNKRY